MVSYIRKIRRSRLSLMREMKGRRHVQGAELPHPKLAVHARHPLRINGLGTPAGLADLAALTASSAAPDFLILPKTDTAAHLQILDELLTAVGRKTRLVALIESVNGLAAIESIAQATPRLAAMMFGAADMAADLGAETAWEPLLHARSRLVAAARSGGVVPLDSPFFDVKDDAGL